MKVFVYAFALSVLAFAANAQSDGSFSNAGRFMERDGEALYRNVCQGCHMANGQGAAGAGTYPALARDKKLETAGYPLSIVLNGQKGMQGFARMMNDAQVAAVVNYVRSHFGNAYSDAVTEADVKAAR
jgi:mono/diheme cytochrome c family protein